LTGLLFRYNAIMKAIISDIHGNFEALQAVIADSKCQGVQDIYCLGDLVCYGPNPCECIDLAMKWKLNLLGNFDHALSGNFDGFGVSAYRSMNWTIAQMENKQNLEAYRKFMAKLPRTHQEGEFLFVHGSARNPLYEYVFPEDIYNQKKMDAIFALVDRYCFQGHTHLPGVFTESLQDDLYNFQSPEEIECFHKLDNRKTLVNVGSVGQPRDGDWRACYTLLDGNTVLFRRVEYDVDTTVKKIYSITDLDHFLGDRLRKGR
jgi:diadenosine tetraphosphatase ApaH/serine/threonine PP2A family protein phosphatase